MVRTTALLAALILSSCADAPVTTRVERQVIEKPVAVKAKPDAALVACGRQLPAVHFQEREDLKGFLLLSKPDALALMQAGDELAGCILIWRTWAAP